LQGSDGPRGDKGDKGNIGPIGPIGLQGIPGNIGPEGVSFDIWTFKLNLNVKFTISHAD
jgi:hypothetical protein